MFGTLVDSKACFCSFEGGITIQLEEKVSLDLKVRIHDFFYEQFYKNIRTHSPHVLFISTSALPFSCVELIRQAVFTGEKKIRRQK